MGKIIDLTGQTFGRLTVLEQGGRDSQRNVLWLCECSCPEHNQVLVSSINLRNGKTQSCGCLKKELAKRSIQKIQKSAYKDLTGQKFGKLTVLKDNETRDSCGAVEWLCQCDCGGQVVVAGTHLRNGNTQSCGCIKSKGEEMIARLLTENNIPFIREQKFDTCYFQNENNKARFDFYVNNQYLIEYDGSQHFEIKGWNTLENFNKVQEHDKIKTKWCKENNIPLIRIPYTHLKNLCIEDLLLETSQFICLENES